ncbi:hypothetical protein FPOA_03211 [Fusarium poae]|uniref:Uncharacterized protein n=1 Tax=Fusarium poae TaxID=36050 RepID=A0A1B8B973_FUSPO|nr:hypothetical protein FPOA_03211 [Fusarium poae]
MTLFAELKVNKRIESCKNCETHGHKTTDCNDAVIDESDKTCERTFCAIAHKAVTHLTSALLSISFALLVDEGCHFFTPHPLGASGAPADDRNGKQGAWAGKEVPGLGKAMIFGKLIIKRRANRWSWRRNESRSEA